MAHDSRLPRRYGTTFSQGALQTFRERLIAHDMDRRLLGYVQCAAARGTSMLLPGDNLDLQFFKDYVPLRSRVWSIPRPAAPGSRSMRSLG